MQLRDPVAGLWGYNKRQDLSFCSHGTLPLCAFAVETHCVRTAVTLLKHKHYCSKVSVNNKFDTLAVSVYECVYRLNILLYMRSVTCKPVLQIHAIFPFRTMRMSARMERGEV